MCNKDHCGGWQHIDIYIYTYDTVLGVALVVNMEAGGDLTWLVLGIAHGKRDVGVRTVAGNSLVA
jgi:hypothetical protein